MTHIALSCALLAGGCGKRTVSAVFPVDDKTQEVSQLKLTDQQAICSTMRATMKREATRERLCRIAAVDGMSDTQPSEGSATPRNTDSPQNTPGAQPPPSDEGRAFVPPDGDPPTNNTCVARYQACLGGNAPIDIKIDDPCDSATPAQCNATVAQLESCFNAAINWALSVVDSVSCQHPQPTMPPETSLKICEGIKDCPGIGTLLEDLHRIGGTPSRTPVPAPVPPPSAEGAN
ncbi:MAG: hypothetical protein H6707_13945 [Deltaproteobacteria bacterium]|nr:hypothetical protein [Deltaproteobacteria bacterium]